MNLMAEVPGAGQPQSRPAPLAPDSEAGLHTLLSEAVRRRATHVHVDPVEAGAVIALRIGGHLSDGGTLSPDALQAVVAEVAAAANFETEPGRARRGSLHWAGNEVAVATLPSGDSISMTFKLDTVERRDRQLEALGLRQSLITALRPALAKGGLVLVAGPAESGRSTTLRALLDHAAGKARRQMVIEAVAGPAVAGATHVLATAECSMAEALRAALHHDVDVVLADGLIDRASATAAVEAAQSGLLVLAAVPAVDGVGAIRRMREWRIEPFHLASTLNAVLAQRLVKRLCPECREPVQAQGSVSALLGFDRGAIVYAPTGCAACGDSGYAGQIAVFEAIHADPAMRRLINDGGDEAILARHAYVSAPNLGSAARTLVREGVTTPEEAVRVSRT
jgi:general secretion pathway protein E